MQKSRFTEFFIQLNGLDARGFEGWVFDAGMLFNDIHVWWRDGVARRQPHEGVDFYCYHCGRQGEKVKRPLALARFHGMVASIFSLRKA